ncbi:hypothetical protein TrRE_jg8177, partial [Triparma retinervis]
MLNLFGRTLNRRYLRSYHSLRVSELGPPKERITYHQQETSEDGGTVAISSPDSPKTSAHPHCVKPPKWQVRPPFGKDPFRFVVDSERPFEVSGGDVLGAWAGRAFKTLMVQDRTIQSILGVDPHFRMSQEDLDNVVVAPLISSVNTADLNTIEGTYPIKPGFVEGPDKHSVPGSEFVGQVVSSESPLFNPGDLVIPNTVGLGSWCSCLPPLPAYNFTPVSSLHFEGTEPYDIPIHDLLGVQVNPSTAYIMLHDSGRAPLSPGDVVILTAGKSAVATAAAQIAKCKFGAKVVSVVRRKDRTDKEWQEVEAEMKEYGVDLLLEEEKIKKTPPRKLIETIQKVGKGKVKLCLDSVGGKVGTRLSLCLTKGEGTHVTYGGLSREAVSVGAGTAIFSDNVYKGFWLTRWMNNNIAARGTIMDMRPTMMRELLEMVKEGMLKLPETKLFHLSDFEGAFDEVQKGNPSSSPPLTDNGSDGAYDSIDDARSSGSAEKDSVAFNEDSDNDVAWLNQPKSPTNQLFETLKVQMEQTDFSSSTKNDQYTDSRFIDAPIPLMDFPATPINREWEHPKTGMSYKLPFVEHEHSGYDPDLLLATDSDDGSHPKKTVPLEPLHDKKFSSFVSNLLSQRTKQENVVFLDEIEDSTPPPASNAYPHGTLVYDFESIAAENKNVSADLEEGESFFESGNLLTAHYINGRKKELPRPATVAATEDAGENTSPPNVPNEPSPPPPSYQELLKPVDQEYDLRCKFDTHTVGNIQWYYFSAEPPQTATFPLRVRFNLINMMKKSSLYQNGMRPLMYSSGEKLWKRGCEEISYYRNKYSYEPKGKRKKKQRHSTLSFVYTFTKHEAVFFSHCYPYTYSDLQKDIITIFERTSQDKASCFIRTRDMCLTLAGNRCELLTITSVANDPEEMEKRPAVVLSARVHPGESNSSYMMRGVLRFLCSNNPDAKVLRDNFVFKIVPMLNPDGVIHGNYRCSLSGMDLNRRYASPSAILHPTVFSMRQLLSTTQESRGVILFVDMHGHSRKKNTFLYGCDHGSKNLEQRLLPRVFPRLLHNVFRSGTEGGFFSYQDCDFNVKKGKNSTGRVVAWRDVGIDNAFTLEASFAGTGDNLVDTGRKKEEVRRDGEGPNNAPSYFHFGIDDFENIGVGICKTLLHYCRIGSSSDKLKEHKKGARAKYAAAMAELENSLTVSCELKPAASASSSPPVPLIESLISEGEGLEVDDLIEAGMSGDSLGSDSDPSGDNMPANLLLKDKEFQKFVQRSTVAPQLAHMELNNGRRAAHKKISKQMKKQRKGSTKGGGQGNKAKKKLQSAARMVIKQNREKKKKKGGEGSTVTRQPAAETTSSDLLNPRPLLPSKKS